MLLVPENSPRDSGRHLGKFHPAFQATVSNLGGAWNGKFLDLYGEFDKNVNIL